MSSAITPAQKIGNLQKWLTTDGSIGQMAAAARGNMTSAERRNMALTYIRIGLSSVQKNPRLADCTPASVLASMIQSVQLGLEPDNISGLAYLVPFKNICTMIPGYKGLIQLMYRSAMVKDVIGDAVYSEDHYKYARSLPNGYEHEPSMKADRGAFVAAYMHVRLMTGGSVLRWMWSHQIEKIRLRSPSVKSGRTCPWDTDFEAMAIKTAVRSGAKWVPSSSTTLSLAVALDEKAEGLTGDSGMIEGDFTVMDPPPEPPPSVAPSAPKPPAEKPQPPDELPPEAMPEDEVPFDAQIGMKSPTYEKAFAAFDKLTSPGRDSVKEAHGLSMITDVAKMTSEEANNFLIACEDAPKQAREGGAS